MLEDAVQVAGVDAEPRARPVEVDVVHPVKVTERADRPGGLDDDGRAGRALALGLVVRATRATDPGPAWLPAGRPLVRIAVVTVATALFIGLMGVVGMALGTVLFLVGVLRFLEGHGWAATLGVAVGTALANWLIFSFWLGVPFPRGVLGF